MDDKDMLKTSAENPADKMLENADIPPSTEISNNTDSQLNNNSAEPKKTRKRSTKPKTTDTATEEVTDTPDAEASSEETAEPKKTRKRSTKPKTADTAAEEVTDTPDAETSSEETAEPKKTRKRSTKPKTADTATEEATDTPDADSASDEDQVTERLFPASTYITETASENSAEAKDEEASNDFSSSDNAVTDEEATDAISEEDVNITDISFENGDASDAGEEIIHPDNLFSIREPVKSERSDNGASDEALRSDEKETHVNEEGQYIIPELDTVDEDEDELYEEDAPLEKYDPEKPRKIDGRFDFVELFVFTLLAVMIITTFFFRHSVVKGDSMNNTLYDGEHLIISDFLYTPERGDIVVCQDHTANLNTPIVKRVIAVGGETIRITPTAIYVDGKKLEEDYVYIDPYATPYRYTPLTLDVPEGEVFVMGDHRNDSKDSRDLIDLGTVSEDAILGKVLIRFYPFDQFGAVE